MSEILDREIIDLPDEAATAALGAAIARALRPGLKVYLSGELGSGKTALTRAVLRGCGVTGRVKSPSYSLVEPYKLSSIYFYHFDFYRFADPSEWLDAGLREHFDDRSVVFLEWPEKGAGVLPPPDWQLDVEVLSDARRRVHLSARSALGVACLEALRKDLASVPSPSARSISPTAPDAH